MIDIVTITLIKSPFNFAAPTQLPIVVFSANFTYNVVFAANFDANPA